MIIAQRKKKENIAEYLLYMWQLEDRLRALNFDMEQIKQQLIDPFLPGEELRKEMIDWYENLLMMMQLEGVKVHGHLQINKNVLIELTQLHLQLLQDHRQMVYQSEFFKTLPFIVELRSKAGGEPEGEIESCFTALYGVLLLRLKGVVISESTLKAVQQISSFLALLTKIYHTPTVEEV